MMLTLRWKMYLLRWLHLTQMCLQMHLFCQHLQLLHLLMLQPDHCCLLQLPVRLHCRL